MLIIFKSKAFAEVVMVEKNGKEMLAILGKHPDDSRGVVSVEQLPDAINTLKALIESRQAIRQAAAKTAGEPGGQGGEAIKEVDEVDISLRAMPLLELLEHSLVEKLPVTWGV